LLLYGPPGTGKSTMAKVLAQHCGYEPLEVNASDERTG
jgi:replication-associated recombination protein RarA